jgi:nucleotide-binding universal stress UspA family protein
MLESRPLARGLLGSLWSLCGVRIRYPRLDLFQARSQWEADGWYQPSPETALIFHQASRRGRFVRQSPEQRLTGSVAREMSIFPTKILVAADGSEEADLALQTATDLAKYTGSELHLVYVEAASYVPPTADWETLGTDYLPNRLTNATMAAAKSQVDRQVQRVRGGGGEIAGAHAREGFPDAEIVDLAEELGAGLLVMGSRGHGGVRRALVGSVSDSVVRHAHCPVLVVRP